MKPNQEQLKKLMRYDPETGIFSWRVSRGGTRIGQISGCVSSGRYLTIRIFDTLHKVHRLAWLYMTGEWPKDQIDHINGNTRDNRWVNLREADRFINQQNQRKPRSDNTTGFLGVSQKNSVFVASIRFQGKKRHLGYYLTPEAAHAAYLKAKRQFHSGCTI